MADDDLKRCQQASMGVEEAMVARLLNFTPAHDLKVGEVLWIAREARAIAFDLFYVKARE